jgi:MoaA/NifB/PqqE/SkfB family radical SAM enzyme
MKDFGLKNKDFPELDLNLTNRCNFLCRHCGYDAGVKMVPELDTAQIISILQDFKNSGGRFLDLTGGEPLLRPDLEEIISAAKSLGLEVRVLTNAALLNRERLESLQKAGLDGLGISLDGSNYGTYHRLRPVSRRVFDQVVENIRLSCAAGLKVRINTVVSRSNLSDLGRIAALSFSLGVRDQRFCFLSAIGRGADCASEIVGPDEFLSTLQHELAPFTKKMNISFGIPQLPLALATKVNSICRLESQHHFELRSDLKLYPCPLIADSSQLAGCPLRINSPLPGYQHVCPLIKIDLRQLLDL